MTVHDIRLLSADEVPLLVPLIRLFFAEGGIAGKLNESHSIANLRQHINAGTGFVLVAGIPIRAGISGITYLDIGTAELCCMEFFWYVSAPERGSSIGLRLLNAWEQEAVKRGAKRLLMAHIENEKTMQFAKLYERHGYVKREQIYMKEVAQ
jgi:GNAT superfamily N-acetyltransferase